MSCVEPAAMSTPPAEELSITIYTRVAPGVVGYVFDSVHEMAPHVILLVVKVELSNAKEGDACPLIRIIKSLLVVGP